MKTFKEFVQNKQTINAKDPKVMNLLASKITDPKKKMMLQKAMNTTNANADIDLGTALGVEDLASRVNSTN